MALVALIVPTAIWGVENGGTLGSPLGPLLYSSRVPAKTSAPAGRSAAPPGVATPMVDMFGSER